MELEISQPKIELNLSEKVSSKRSLTSVFWKQGEFYLKDKKREATVTDVKYLSDNLLVVAHRAAAKLYLVEYIDSTFEIIDTIVLDTAKGTWNLKKRLSGARFFHPDLISVSGNVIYSTNYRERCCIVEVVDRKLQYRNIIEIQNTQFHGCFIEDNNLYLGSVLCGHIYRYNLQNQDISKISTGLAAGKRIKTIGVDQDYFVLGVDRLTGSTTEQGAIIDTWISLYTKNAGSVELSDNIELPETQVDGHTYYNGYHFFALHNGNENNGYIGVFQIINAKLEFVKKIPCHAFPHGIDICDGKLMYACYSRSSIIEIDLKTQDINLDFNVVKS